MSFARRIAFESRQNKRSTLLTRTAAVAVTGAWIVLFPATRCAGKRILPADILDPRLGLFVARLGTVAQMVLEAVLVAVIEAQRVRVRMRRFARRELQGRRESSMPVGVREGVHQGRRLEEGVRVRIRIRIHEALVFIAVVRHRVR